MDYNEFKEYIKCSALKMLGEEYEGKLHTVMKNNSVNMDAILLNKKGSKVSPTIYLENYWIDYQKGRTLESITNSVCNIVWANRTPDFGDVDKFCEFENVKDRVVYKIINYAENEELLSKVPYVKVLDLAIVFLVLVDDDTLSNASVLIHNSHAAIWNVDAEVLYNEIDYRVIPRARFHIDAAHSSSIFEEFLGKSDGQFRIRVGEVANHDRSTVPIVACKCEHIVPVPLTVILKVAQIPV